MQELARVDVCTGGGHQEFAGQLESRLVSSRHGAVDLRPAGGDWFELGRAFEKKPTS